MRAYEAHLDSRSRDLAHDFLTKHHICQNSLSYGDYIKYREQLQVRDGRERLSVAQNYFALACPIAPLGILGAFFFLSKLGGSYDRPELEKEILTRQRQDLANALYVTAMRERVEKEKKKGGLIASMPEEIVFKSGKENKAKKNHAPAFMPEGKSNMRVASPSVLSREQQDVGKVIQKKMQMQSDLTQLVKSQDYSGVCRVSSKIELLDKALKKMGC